MAGRAALDVGAVGLQLGVLVGAGRVSSRDLLDLGGLVVTGGVTERGVVVGAQCHGSEVPGRSGRQPQAYGGGVRLVPTPRDVLGAVGRGGDALEILLAAAPRVAALLVDVERLVVEVAALVNRIEGTRASVDELVARLEPPLTTLQPTLERLAETTAPHEVDALVALVDHLPRLVSQLETDVLPVLTTLGSVAPDLHDLLDTSRELNVMLAKMPGFGRVRRRVEDRQDDEE